MKIFRKLLFIGLIAFSGLMEAQTKVTTVVTPGWAPSKTGYYYIRDIDSYYDANTGEYITVNNGQWVRTKALPVRYSTYKIQKSRVVPISYVGKTPYVHYKTHKVKYHKGTNPMVVTKSVRHDNGLHRGHTKGKGHGKGHGRGNNDKKH